MSYISKSGIQAGSIIKSDHVLRIIDALDGTDAKDINVTGILSATYLAGNGSQVTNVTASLAQNANYALTASTVPVTQPFTPTTGSVYIDPATNTLWAYTGNGGISGWVSTSLG